MLVWVHVGQRPNGRAAIYVSQMVHCTRTIPEEAAQFCIDLIEPQLGNWVYNAGRFQSRKADPG